MQALFLENGNLQYLTDYPRPQPTSDEALIRVTLAGICSTDLEIMRGYVPGYAGVLGHEFVGVVESAADASWVGARVVGGISLACGECDVCHQYGPSQCPQRRTLGIRQKDGVFADYITLPLINLQRVPDNVPDETAVFCELLAAALRIREQVLISPTDHVAVIGPGRFGLLITQIVAMAGTQVILLGRRETSLRLPQQLGLDTGLTTDYSDNHFDKVVDVTGNEAGFAQALRLVRPLGTIILKSTYAGDAHLNLTKLVVGEITVIGSRCGPFAPALRLLASGAINVSTLIETEYALRDGEAAMAHAAQPGVLKVLLRP